jgi:OPA family glycerol-3-phosphate transporter-like MFS transporter 1/2
VTSANAAYYSILFDVGGILGGILAGMATDYSGKSATTCAVMLIGAIPTVSQHFLKYLDVYCDRD